MNTVKITKENINESLFSKLTNIHMRESQAASSFRKLSKTYSEELLLQASIKSKIYEEEQKRNILIAEAYRDDLVEGSNNTLRDNWILLNIPPVDSDLYGALNEITAQIKESEALLSSMRFTQRSHQAEIEIVTTMLELDHPGFEIELPEMNGDDQHDDGEDGDDGLQEVIEKLENLFVEFEEETAVDDEEETAVDEDED